MLTEKKNCLIPSAYLFGLLQTSGDAPFSLCIMGKYCLGKQLPINNIHFSMTGNPISLLTLSYLLVESLSSFSVLLFTVLLVHMFSTNVIYPISVFWLFLQWQIWYWCICFRQRLILVLLLLLLLLSERATQSDTRIQIYKARFSLIFT